MRHWQAQSKESHSADYKTWYERHIMSIRSPEPARPRQRRVVGLTTNNILTMCTRGQWPGWWWLECWGWSEWGDRRSTRICWRTGRLRTNCRPDRWAGGSQRLSRVWRSGRAGCSRRLNGVQRSGRDGGSWRLGGLRGGVWMLRNHSSNTRFGFLSTLFTEKLESRRFCLSITLVIKGLWDCTKNLPKESLSVA